MIETRDLRSALLTPWRPLYWEPVEGTGERIMVGVVHGYDRQWRSHQILRDDVLQCLYGKSAAGVKKLLAHAFEMYAAAAEASDGLADLNFAMAGLVPGPLRETEASSLNDLLRTAALLYSSLAQIDAYDEADENDAPMTEEVNRRFSTEVRDLVIAKDPALSGAFGRGGRLTEGGQIVKFGFFSPKAILHFSVLHPVRQPASVRDARAKLWELSRASEMSGIAKASLIVAVPREDDPHLGDKQRSKLRVNRHEIEREADDARIRLHAVRSAEEGAEKVLEIVA